MSKRFMCGILLLAVAVLVLLINSHGSTRLDLLLFEIRNVRLSLALFTFLSSGVAIGFLLR